ncbi:V-type proton ATPase subunit F-like [Lemur catta]|uniref:V-type proton ATPase subunit F-like n=1 Tax=Lemur catta TaxID=9447 RepID=UPI001E266999|nr:V-type proton ATPase subunit F-like [Lemur catta]
MAGRGKLIAVIRDEDTVTGFLLCGIAELNKNRHPNFPAVGKDAAVNEIEDTFPQFLNQDDVSLILVNQHLVEAVQLTFDAHSSVPVLVITSKEQPYGAAEDSVLGRARGTFTAKDPG